MICNAYRAKTTSAALALVAGGCFAMTGVAAEPAAAQSGEGGWLTEVAPSTDQKPADKAAGPTASESSSEAGMEGWLTQVTTRDSLVDPADGKSDVRYADPQYVGAPAENETTDGTAEVSSGADSNQDLFQPDPQYDVDYDAEQQVDIYGGKTAVEAPRPLLEIGREQYTSGIYDESSTFLGEKNPLLPGLSIYGDWRTAVAYNNFNGKDIAQIATRLNLDVDFKITGTERLHAFFTPLQNGAAEFTRYEFGGADGNDTFNDEFDLNPQTLFFEGDAGSIYSGFSGEEASFDLPFTFGLFPLFLQNGIWANDAILGAAVSLPAKNSAALGLANFDITFFAAFDDVDNGGIIGVGEDDDASLYGVTAFIDAFDGYIEAGYGLIDGRDDEAGLLTHFVTGAYTRRYYNTVSNSTRVFANFGDAPGGESDGFALISENSLITGLPSTLLPYANFFVGAGNPQPLVDGNNAGILKNVGINFETDALTGYPKLDDSGSDAFGGAIGLQYLFNLDQQLVFEVATVQPFANDGIGAQDPQYGFGVRYQVPIDRAWLFRADATYQILEGEDEDNFGIRTELRRKF